MDAGVIAVREIRCRCGALLAVKRPGELHVHRDGMDVWIDALTRVRIRCYCCSRVVILTARELR